MYGGHLTSLPQLHPPRDAPDAINYIDFILMCGPTLSLSLSFILYETLLDARCCRVLDGLTEDAAAARLALSGFAPPLYLHAALPPPAAARLKALAAQTHAAVVALPGSIAAPLDPAPGSFLQV